MRSPIGSDGRVESPPDSAPAPEPAGGLGSDAVSEAVSVPAAQPASHDAPAIIEAIDLRVAYGAVVALDGISLSVGAGEWLAVDGPSGSGKSTLLSMLAALDHPDAGVIKFRGRDLTHERHLDHYRRFDVGLVFQLHNLIPHLDARHNVEIAMLGTGRSRSARRRAVDELLEGVQLQAQASRRPAEMSGGERQRVAIARALANHPALLLADEPTGNLDPEAASNVVDVFRELHAREGMTIVMVTHDPAVAVAADRVVTIAKGRIVEPVPDRVAAPDGVAAASDDAHAAGVIPVVRDATQ